MRMGLRKLRLVIVTMAAAVVAACEGVAGSPDARDHAHVADMLADSAPTMRDAAAATYFGALGRRITLDDGEALDRDGARVRLVPGFYATADVNGDGAQNAAVVLDVTDAGDASGKYVAFLRQDHFHTISLGTFRLGNPVTVRAIRTDGNRVVVDLTRRRATDAECCPTEEATVSLVFADGVISEAPAQTPVR
jgi:hypothetical protein